MATITNHSDKTFVSKLYQEDSLAYEMSLDKKEVSSQTRREDTFYKYFPSDLHTPLLGINEHSLENVSKRYSNSGLLTR